MITAPLNFPIHLIAPSGAINNKSACLNGVNWLSSNGYEVQNLRCLDRQFQRFAGNDDDRLKEIESLYEISNSNSIVMSIRGGYGVSRVLPFIKWDKLADLVSKGVKFVGHSDFTAFEIALFAKTHAISFAGPMLSYDFGIEDPNIPAISKFTFNSFQDAILNKTLNLKITEPQIYLSKDIEIHLNERSLLWGGNLSMLVNLLGTSNFPNLNLINNGALFLEDVNEHPYRIERMLWQLLEAGVLSSQKAILLGDFSAYKLSTSDDGYNFDSAIHRINAELKVRGAKTVILNGLPFRHIRDKATLPIGVPISLTASNNGFNLKANW